VTDGLADMMRSPLPVLHFEIECNEWAFWLAQSKLSFNSVPSWLARLTLDFSPPISTGHGLCNLAV